LKYDLIKKKIQVTPNGQILLHLNLNSLQAHIDELIELIQAMDTHPTFILISETRLRTNQ